MRTKDINNPVERVDIAYNDAIAIARGEQARVLRALLQDVLNSLFRRDVPHRPCPSPTA